MQVDDEKRKHYQTVGHCACAAATPWQMSRRVFLFFCDANLLHFTSGSSSSSIRNSACHLSHCLVSQITCHYSVVNWRQYACLAVLQILLYRKNLNHSKSTTKNCHILRTSNTKITTVHMHINQKYVSHAECSPVP